LRLRLRLREREKEKEREREKVVDRNGGVTRHTTPAYNIFSGLVA